MVFVLKELTLEMILHTSNILVESSGNELPLNM